MWDTHSGQWFFTQCWAFVPDSGTKTKSSSHTVSRDLLPVLPVWPLVGGSLSMGLLKKMTILGSIMACGTLWLGSLSSTEWLVRTGKIQSLILKARTKCMWSNSSKKKTILRSYNDISFFCFCFYFSHNHHFNL